MSEEIIVTKASLKKRIRKPFHRRKPPNTISPVTAMGERKLTVTGAPDRREDAQLVARLIENLRDGCTYDNAARCAGIAPGTFFRWMAEGKAAPEGTLAHDFRDKVLVAEEEAIKEHTLLLKKHAKKSPHVSMWFLSRRRPKEWAEVVKVGGAGKDADPVEMNVNVGGKTTKALLSGIKAVLSEYPDLLQTT